MAYVPNPADPTQPTGNVDASTADDEFRALKGYIQTLAFAAGTFNSARQCAQDGAKDANGLPAFLTLPASAGLSLDLDAAPNPLSVNFAGGQGPVGNNDRVGYLTNDAPNVVAGLDPQMTDYIYADYVSAGTWTWAKTPVPPQYGYAFDRTKYGLMHFEGANGSTAMIDDAGNAWTANGNAKLDTSQSKIGLSSLLLDGTGDYVETTDIKSFGGGSWSQEIYVRWGTLPIAAGRQTIISTRTASDDLSTLLYLFNNAGVMKMELYLSSLGAGAYDIANALVGTKTVWAINTWYHIVLTFDALAGKYLVYVDGTVDLTVVSSVRVASFSSVRLGRGNVASPRDFNGWMDEFRLTQYCPYPNGTVFVPPIVASTLTGDYFDIQAYKMYSISAASVTSGVNPTLTQKYRAYLGEADSGLTTTTAVRNYAYNGKYSGPFVTPLSGVSTTFSQSHNLGVVPLRASITLENQITDSGYKPGERIVSGFTTDSALSRAVPIRSNTLSVSAALANTTANATIPAAGGASVGITAASWKYRFDVDRGW